MMTDNNAIQVCFEYKDTGSRDLIERMVVELEQNLDWAEARPDLVKMVGLENNFAQQMGEPRKD